MRRQYALAAAIGAAIALESMPSSAAIIEYEITGELATVPVQLAPQLTPGLAFTATFQLDTSVPNLAGDPLDGSYQQTLNWTIDFPGYSVSGQAGPPPYFNFFTRNAPDGDHVVWNALRGSGSPVGGGFAPLAGGILFLDPSGTALDTTDIPLEIDLSDFATARLEMRFFDVQAPIDQGPFDLTGRITSVVRSDLPVSSVPEPGILMLLSGALLGLGAARVTRRASAA